MGCRLGGRGCKEWRRAEPEWGLRPMNALDGRGGSTAGFKCGQLWQQLSPGLNIGAEQCWAALIHRIMLAHTGAGARHEKHGARRSQRICLHRPVRASARGHISISANGQCKNRMRHACRRHLPHHSSPLTSPFEAMMGSVTIRMAPISCTRAGPTPRTFL